MGEDSTRHFTKEETPMTSKCTKTAQPHQQSGKCKGNHSEKASHGPRANMYDRLARECQQGVGWPQWGTVLWSWQAHTLHSPQAHSRHIGVYPREVHAVCAWARQVYGLSRTGNTPHVITVGWINELWPSATTEYDTAVTRAKYSYS